MNRLADVAESLRQVRSGRVLVLSGATTGRVILARSLARELRYYLQDLSAVVSKYISETEMNLSPLLAAAGNPASILLFDEADSLFGQRTGVEDAHGRYADLVRALLSARGLVVLGVDRPERLPYELRHRACVIAVRDYWPPR